ncbi:trimeric LpxA-like protein, partial [Rhizodiscina lignyota]
KPKTEKEKMIAGEEYYPYTAPLIDEREACKAALWRFNNSQNPANGVSREERARLFRSILVPSSNDIRRSTNPMHPVGQLGKDVVVEAPFHCQYGYNITIGENVVIESNCTVMDTCRVTIGNDCIIGPNVSIYSATVSLTSRNGSKGPQKGKMVHIGDNVFIGGNVVIKPGVNVGRGAVIGAGTVV